MSSDLFWLFCTLLLLTSQTFAVLYCSIFHHLRQRSLNMHFKHFFFLFVYGSETLLKLCHRVDPKFHLQCGQFVAETAFTAIQIRYQIWTHTAGADEDRLGIWLFYSQCKSSHCLASLDEYTKIKPNHHSSSSLNYISMDLAHILHIKDLGRNFFTEQEVEECWKIQTACGLWSAKIKKRTIFCSRKCWNKYQLRWQVNISA